MKTKTRGMMKGPAMAVAEKLECENAARIPADRNTTVSQSHRIAGGPKHCVIGVLRRVTGGPKYHGLGASLEYRRTEASRRQKSPVL